MKYIVLFSLLFLGCAPMRPMLDDSIRTFYIAKDYESSFQRCVYFLSKASYLIIQADKSDGFISTGYKDIKPDRSIRLNLNLKKISNDSTCAMVTIYTKSEGSDQVFQDQEQYREIITVFTSTKK